MIPTLETRRLILRPLELADAERTQQLFPQWEIVKHLAARFPWPFPPDGALIYFRDDALPAIARGDVYFEETPSIHGPSGAKGIGELPMDGPALAILNAIEHATGIAFTEIPLLPEDIFERMTRAGVPHPSQSLRDGWDVNTQPARSGGTEDLDPTIDLDTRVEATA